MQITALHLFQTKYKIWLEIMKTTLTCCLDNKPRSLNHSLQCLFVFQDFFLFLNKLGGVQRVAISGRLLSAPYSWG